MLLNLFQAGTLRFFSLRLLGGAIVWLWRPAPDGVRLDEDARPNLVRGLTFSDFLDNISIFVRLVAVAQLFEVKHGVSLLFASLQSPLAHIGVVVDLKELFGSCNIVGIEVAFTLALALVGVGVALPRDKHLRVNPSVRVSRSESHSWVRSND